MSCLITGLCSLYGERTWTCSQSLMAGRPEFTELHTFRSERVHTKSTQVRHQDQQGGNCKGCEGDIRGLPREAKHGQ